MAIDPRAAVARLGAFFASRSAAAWWLGAAAAVVGFVLVDAFVVGPEYLPSLTASGLGPGTYYLAHHPDALSDESRPWDVASFWPFALLYLVPKEDGWVAIGVTVVSFAGVGVAVMAMAELDGRAWLERERDECERDQSVDDDPTARAAALAVRRDPLRRWTTRSWPAQRACAAWTWLAAVLRSNEMAARCLGLSASVAGFLLVGEVPTVPDVVPWVALFSFGPFAYYRTHYGRVPVDVPHGRRVLRMLAVVLPTSGVTREGASLLAVAVTAVTFALLLESVTLAEQSRLLAEHDEAVGDDADDGERVPPWRRPACSENR
ncbi:hypothetical protein [Halorubellus litoreus]|uniref:Uncharacterized protein n=1 Tax=Halorubellus litoreus TaxID=755308 RepID=A0ABD5VIR5_9EURY